MHLFFITARSIAPIILIGRWDDTCMAMESIVGCNPMAPVALSKQVDEDVLMYSRHRCVVELHQQSEGRWRALLRITRSHWDTCMDRVIKHAFHFKGLTINAAAFICTFN